MISEEAMQRMKAKVQQRVGATPPATWAKVGVGVLVGGVAIGWIAFPYVLDKVVASQINLAQGRDSRRLWVQLPTLGCLMYVFNVTNPAEVMRGAKPIVQEIGPYCYKEVKDKTDFVEDPTTDTISYSARSTWYENQRSSDCPAPHLTGDEVVTVPNVPILSILLIAEKDFPAPFLTLVSQALPTIFGRVNDLFMRVTARSLLFDGILVNCTATALYPRAVCIALKQNSRALKKLSENVYSFSFFGAKNHTPEEFRYTVKRGTVDGQEIGRLVAIDGKPELPFWRGDCNKIQGTDASVFPPFRKMENGSLVAYSSEACRIIFGIYEGDTTYKGVTGYVYTALPFGDVETNPGDRCYCPADDRCRKKGVLDALKCQGAPIVSSHPHFYQASQQYVNGVVGLKPEKEKHEIKIILEPISGTPLVVRKRIQFNIELKAIRFVPLTQRLRRSLVPLFWAEEMLDLDGNLMGLLEASLFRPIRAVDVIKWLCVVGGVGLGVLGVVLKVRQYRRDKVHAINGEAGGVFGHESNPKSALKPEKIYGDTEILDPFYIKTEETQGSNGKIMNGVHAAVFKSSASTMTALNVLRPASLSNLDVKRLLVQDNVSEIAAKTLATNQSQANDTSSSTLLDKKGSKTPENSGNFDDPANRKIGRAEHATLETPTNPSSENNPQNSPTDNHFHSPKMIASLEHQMTFKSPTNSIHSLNQAYNEPTYELPTTNQTNASDGANAGSEYGGPRDTVINLGDNENTIDSKLNQETDFQTAPNNYISLENAFGDSISVEEIQSVSESPDKINSENKTTADNAISNETSYPTADRHQETFSDETKPSEEEIKAVEEDINKLMAEMAELLPRNKGFAVSDSINSNS